MEKYSQSWDGRSRTCYESSHVCLSPSTSKPLVRLNQTGHPRSVSIDRLLLTKTQAGAVPANLCKDRNNCNLPGDNCQVVSASEFCSHTTVTYQSLTSPARALGPVDIQEFNEPELALMVCMLTSRLVIHKFNISLKRKKLLPQRMMRMQELGRDYKRFCSSWPVAKARVNLASLTCFKEVSVAGARCAMKTRSMRLLDHRLPLDVRQGVACGGCYSSALREKSGAFAIWRR